MGSETSSPFRKSLQTSQQTDRPTDRRTDMRAHRVYFQKLNTMHQNVKIELSHLLLFLIMENLPQLPFLLLLLCAFYFIYSMHELIQRDNYN